MSHPQAFIKMSNGLQIPSLGLGTYDNTDQAGYDVLKRLIGDKVYVHIDTASFYANEAGIGEVLHELTTKHGIQRKDLFITSKVFTHEIVNLEATLKKTLKDLQLDYIDLYLIHWPIQTSGTMKDKDNKIIRVPLSQTWAQLEGLVEKGLIKSIGVSNFNFQLLNDLLSYAKIKPVCNQIELHPFLSQHDFVEWLKDNDIVPVAYTPLAKGLGDGKELVPLTEPVIIKIAEKHKRPVGQIVLAWHLARGHVVIPKSAKYERAVENQHALEVKLSPEEVEEINKLNKNYRFVDNKRWGAPFNKIPLWE